jgi:hypothetical protein
MCVLPLAAPLCSSSSGAIVGGQPAEALERRSALRRCHLNHIQRGVIPGDTVVIRADTNICP